MPARQTPKTTLAALASLPREDILALVERAFGGSVTVTFSGKADASRVARKVRPRVLRQVKRLSSGSPQAQADNSLIEGDNLQAMATMYRERGQVDLIVTDPPYNTGNDFRYNDRWETDPNDDGIGELVSAEDGARHTKWMRFMWPRLQMMRSMLRPTGVLAICIDYRELYHLGQMLDELFGEENRLAIINWQKITSPKNQGSGVSTATEYVLVYARDAAKAQTGLVKRSAEAEGSYRDRDGDPLGPWSPGDSTLMGASTHPGQVYGIQNPFTGRLHYPQEGRCWRNERSKMRSAVEEWGVTYQDVQLDDGLRPAMLLKGCADPRELEDPLAERTVAQARETVLARRAQGNWPRFFWRDDVQRNPGEGELRYKTYLSEVKEGVVPTTFWSNEDFEPVDLGSVAWVHQESGTSDAGLKELNAVVGRGHGFDTVKPLKLITKIISLWCPGDGLVLDPFAGSGTTGHAVLAMNAEEGASRRFVLVEQGRPEKGDPYASSLTAKRLSRVVSGKWASGGRDPLGGGFSFQRLDKRVDGQALLQMERDEMVDTVIASHFDANRRRGSNLVRVGGGRKRRYLVARNTDNEGFFLVWDGPDKNTDITRAVYEACVEEAEAEAEPLKRRYHIYARQCPYQSADIVFYQIPDRILADFGLGTNEPFNESES